MVVIGTWNLENLYRPGPPFGPKTAQAYDAKLATLAEEIDHIGPDVLAVQEVGDPDALGDLAARLDGLKHVEVSTAPDERGIRVGFLSRRPLTRLAQVTQFPDQLAPVQVADPGTFGGTTLDTMGRGALVATLPLPDGAPLPEITLVTCHLKSKLLSYPGARFTPRDEDERARYAGYALYRRTAEAVTVRVTATGLLANDGQHRAVIVLGDLNDEPTAATTQILQGPLGSEIGTPGYDRPDHADARRLWNLAAKIPADSRFSRIYQGRRELIDHVLVSHALLGHLQTVATGSTPLPSITDNPARQRDHPGSDHAPVYATFTL